MTSRDQPLVRRERAPVLFVWPAPPVDRPPPPLTWRDAMLHVDIGLGTFGPSPEGAIGEEYKAVVAKLRARAEYVPPAPVPQPMPHDGEACGLRWRWRTDIPPGQVEVRGAAAGERPVLRFVCGGYVNEAAGVRVEVFTLADMDRASVGDVVRLALAARPTRCALRLPRLRVIVTGARVWTAEAPIRRRLTLLGAGSDVVHGACGLDEGDPIDPRRMRGADGIAHRVALELGHRPVPHPARWRTLGRRAGTERNARMLAEELAGEGLDLAFAFPLGASPGTRDMVRRLRAAGVPVDVVEGRP